MQLACSGYRFSADCSRPPGYLGLALAVDNAG